MIRNLSFKHNKFPSKRKISLKVDGKKFQENQFFFIPENKNTSHRKEIYSPDKLSSSARIKNIRNSDKVGQRDTLKEIRTHSRSLNSSGTHNVHRKNLSQFDDSQRKNFNAHHMLSPMTDTVSKKNVVQIKSNRASIDTNEIRSSSKKEENSKIGKNLNLHEKKNSSDSLDGTDFEYSCVELNESRENHFDSESMRHIIDPVQLELQSQPDSITRYAPLMPPIQIQNNDPPQEQFKKRDAEPLKFFEGHKTTENEKLWDTTIQTTESWMKYPSEIVQFNAENFNIPRKISDIPMVGNTKRGSLIVYGGEITPAQRRSILEEKSGTFHKKEVEKGETPPNMQDLMKLIIKKTEDLPTVQEMTPTMNENTLSEERKKTYDVFGDQDSNEIKITDLAQDVQKTLKEEDFSEKKVPEESAGLANEESIQFDSCLTNMPSTVNIESTANMQTIFDLGFDPSMHAPGELDSQIVSSKMRKKGSMLSDERSKREKKFFRVVSVSDEETDSIDQTDSILLMTNQDIAKKRSAEEWEKPPLLAPALPANPEPSKNLFKKAPKIKLPLENMTKIKLPKNNCIIQKFRKSKLGLKITRMSRKAARHEPFKLHSPTTKSITNHTELSNTRKSSPVSKFKQSLKGSHQKLLSEKLWESMLSSKKNCSVDIHGNFEKTLGSISIQSLPRKATDTSVQTIGGEKVSYKAKKKSAAKRFSRPVYINKYLSRLHTNELNKLTGKELKKKRQKEKGSKGKKPEIQVDSVSLRTNTKRENSIYSKVSVHDLMKGTPNMKRSHTMHVDDETQSEREFKSVHVPETFVADALGISEEINQREKQADLIRKRNQKPLNGKVQNIYKPRNLKVEVTESMISEQGGFTAGRQSPPGESQDLESDKSSLLGQMKNSNNDSSFLPFPRSVKQKDNLTNQSKQSDQRKKDQTKILNYYSGRDVEFNIGQREEYGIFSGEKGGRSNR